MMLIKTIPHPPYSLDLAPCDFWLFPNVVYWPPTPPNRPFQSRWKCIFHWRGRVWLTIWTGLKSHGTVTDWCTGREWPVNCMTIISAWWRSNMPFQRRRKWHIPMASYEEILNGRLNYYITRWRQEVSKFGDRRVWRQDVVEKASTQQRAGPPGLPVEQFWRTG